MRSPSCHSRQSISTLVTDTPRRASSILNPSTACTHAALISTCCFCCHPPRVQPHAYSESKITRTITSVAHELRNREKKKGGVRICEKGCSGYKHRSDLIFSGGGGTWVEDIPPQRRFTRCRSTFPPKGLTKQEARVSSYATYFEGDLLLISLMLAGQPWSCPTLGGKIAAGSPIGTPIA